MECTKLKIEMAKDGEVSINGVLEEKDLVEVTCHLLNVASTALAKASNRSKIQKVNLNETV